jgi:FlaA1/EpsC-like NDP-sugar epimerase
MFLVTGYGSIGSLVVDRLRKAGRDVVIIDKDEKAIHKAMTKFKNDPNVHCVVSDIGIKDDVSRIFLQWAGALKRKPIKNVIHTAAMKHVTFCEGNPLLATINNILGINNLLEACLEANITQFVNVSTDKSAYPSNVMGATKFIAERLVLLYDSMGHGKYQSVRLGNVLFSNGSLFPTIAKIVRNRQTLDLTDLRATRFFIRPDEVSEFIVDVALKPYGGQVLIKKLKSATLEVMVKSALALIGEENYEDITINGLRQGEKLHEHLYTAPEITHITDHGEHWSIDYNKVLEPIKVIDSSEFCISQEEFQAILKDLHDNHSTSW